MAQGWIARGLSLKSQKRPSDLQTELQKLYGLQVDPTLLNYGFPSYRDPRLNALLRGRGTMADNGVVAGARRAIGGAMKGGASALADRARETMDRRRLLGDAQKWEQSAILDELENGLQQLADDGKKRLELFGTTPDEGLAGRLRPHLNDQAFMKKVAGVIKDRAAVDSLQGINRPLAQTLGLTEPRQSFERGDWGLPQLTKDELKGAQDALIERYEQRDTSQAGRPEELGAAGTPTVRAPAANARRAPRPDRPWRGRGGPASPSL